ncbi:MAG TPA: DUF3105 domain-containing protein [Chloroflexota bacterium]|nr:DUF3105 domain-containing protein [Chloroflexota bacterium]HUM71037.1 DUF3105 domain-containing protein [Chloroflexota bacterium]
MSKEAENGRKLSKKEQRRQQVARQERNRKLIIIIPVVVLLLGLVAVMAYRAFQPEIVGVTKVAAAAGSQHDDLLQIAFGGLPPLGGKHASRWQNCGIYTEPVLPQNAIHSMEHGAVWISYHPDLPAAQIAALQDKVRGESKLLLSPYPDQSSPIVLSVWDRQLAVDGADDERITAFIDRYRGRTGPEANASCAGGIGTPLG